MNYLKLHSPLILLLIGAIVLVLALGGTATVDAKGLPSTLFSSSPPPHGHGGGSPSPESKGEFDPSNGSEEKPIRDPETPGFAAVFSPGALSKPAQIKFFHTIMPEDIPAPVGGAGAPFFFGVWQREAPGTIERFEHSIVINTRYEETGYTPAQEEHLRIFMYYPALQSWVKLGGQVDIFNKLISGLTTELIPFETGGNTLFMVAVDNTPSLEQSVDESGRTTLYIPGKAFKIQVLPGTVEVGSYFEVTLLPTLDVTNSPTLLGKPIAVAVYYVNHQQSGYSEDKQITEFSKPIKIEFDLTSELLAGVDAPAKLTIVTWRDGQWVDVETLGYAISREGGKIVVDIDKLGIFSVALKK